MIAVLFGTENVQCEVKKVTDILETQNILYKVYGADRPWRGFGQKLACAHQAAQELTEHDHILFIDARDVIVLADPHAIMERFLEFGHPWVCNAEPNIWPANSFKPEDYPLCDSPWKYLNSGAYLARRDFLLECFDRWVKDYPIMFGLDDQQYLASRYIEEPGIIKLDTECRLFQCLIGSGWALELSQGKCYNKHHDTYPLILHHNGGGNIEEYRGILW